MGRKNKRIDSDDERYKKYLKEAGVHPDIPNKAIRPKRSTSTPKNGAPAKIEIKPDLINTTTNMNVSSSTARIHKSSSTAESELEEIKRLIGGTRSSYLKKKKKKEKTNPK